MSYREAFDIIFTPKSRPESAVIDDVHARLEKKGYKRFSTIEMGMVNYSIPEKVKELESRLDDQGVVLGPWTMFFGPRGLWEYSLFVRDDADAVALKLLFSED